MKQEQTNNVESFFRWIVNHPKSVVLSGLIFLIAMAAFLPGLVKDTRSDAFLAVDNPAVVYRDKVKDIFGLSDPMVIALVSKNTIFTPIALNTLVQLTERVSEVDNIDPAGITSLATENNIIGTDEGMEVEPFYEDSITSINQANRVRDAIRDFPLYQGSLVASDETVTLIVAELIDENQAEQTYQDLMDLINEMKFSQDLEVHVAGQGAISGYLGSYIDADAQRINPMAGVIITIIIFVAFMRFGPTLSANLIIASSVLITLGFMAAFDVPFYVITNALPVILIGISVADSIHVYSEYFERRALHPNENLLDSIVLSMVEMWRPITLTTLTTSAGFLGLYFAAYMPPFKAFGIFAALGVTLAGVYSLIFLPALMALLKTEVNQSLKQKIRSTDHDAFAKIMVIIGDFTQRRSKTVVLLAVIISLMGFNSARHILVNEDRIDTFHSSEPLYQADKVINQHFDGTNYLDIVFETNREEGIFEPDVLQKMQALQLYAETLPHVNGSTSIVDYLKQMNRSLNNGDKNQYILPNDKDLVAQYFLLYSTSSDPADFEEEVDYDYQRANVRIRLDSGAYIDNKVVVEAMQDYVDQQVNNESVTANLSGRVNINYHWIKDLGSSHFYGMGIALLLVWIVSSVLFRSAVAGLFALLPVAASILFVYSSMVALSIPLGIGTSMFAAVAIGLGVDFAIHTIDRLRTLYAQTNDIDETLKQFYPTTGRALFFNLLAIALGFAVLIISKVVPLNNFGSIVAISVTTSFVMSLTLLPALIKLLMPGFMNNEDQSDKEVNRLPSGLNASLAIAAIGLAGLVFFSTNVDAEELPDGLWIVKQMNAVDEGIQVTRKLSMKMIDRRGKVRQRETLGYRKYFGDEKRTVLFYLEPRNVKDTAFLTYDYVADEDDQWLYLPALRKSRRVSASDRGDYFLGTDFTYEDIKKEGKYDLQDYSFNTLQQEVRGEQKTYVVEAIPTSKTIARELGYGKIQFRVDASNWVVNKARYWDIKQNELKTLIVSDIRQVDGIWTRHKMAIKNHKTGHTTEFLFSEVDYQTAVKDRVFSRQAITRGAPK